MEIFDLHADIGFDVMQKRKQGKKDILNQYHIQKFHQGGISFVNMASYFEGHETWVDMQEMVLSLKEEIAQCEEVDLVLNKNDLLSMNGHIKAILSVEGMCGIKEDATTKIEWLYQQGVRIASLCWNDENALATGVKGNVNRGLSDMGKEVIEKMIELHMIIDVSHANEKTFWDIMNYSDAIVMATHSNARALCDHPRNLYDEQIQAIQEHHGIIGVVAAPFFVHKEKQKQDVEHLIQHIEYLMKRIGNDHVAIGFDYMDFYEGFDKICVTGLKDASKSQQLIQQMIASGMDEASVAMIALGNALRFLCHSI